MSKVVGRPWKKGQSGNPGGRPKGIAAKAREHGDKALQVLVDALADDSVKIRLDAAEQLLNRGYGKPLTMTADMTNKLEDFDDESLDAAITVLRAAIGSSGEAGSGSAEKTRH